MRSFSARWWVGAIALALSACGSSEKSSRPAVVGTWVFDAAAASEHLKGSGMPNAEIGRALTAFEQMAMEITFAPDQTLKFTRKQLGATVDSEATWSLSENVVQVQPTKIDGEAPTPAFGLAKTFLWKDGRLWLQMGPNNQLPLKRK